MKFESKQFNIPDYTDAERLTTLNKEETGLDWDLKPNLYVYLTNTCRMFLIKDEACLIKGYAIYFVKDHHHYGKKVAVQDVLYIHPDYRKGTLGIRFMKFIESSLENLSVKGIFTQTTKKKDISKLLSRLGYAPVETTYFKEL